MMVVGVLTLAVAARGSVEIGGLTSAMVGLGVACLGPLIGAAADRYGQRSTLLISGAVNSIALGALAWIAFSPLPIWAMLVASFAVGATAPQISPMSRSRLVSIAQAKLPREQRPRTINATLAYESAADEVVFVFGPVVVGVLATVLGAWAPIVGAAALTLVFVTAFALHRTSPPARTAEQQESELAPVSELWRAPLLITVFGIFTVGLFFGSMLTSLTAFMNDRGAPEQAGLLYGAMGVGSAIFAVGVTWFSPKFTLRYRWLVFSTLLLVGSVMLQTVSDVPSMLTALFVIGIGIGPLLVTQYGFGAARTPVGRSATVMTMLGSGVIVGQSLASAVTGIVAESISTQVSLLIPLCSVALGLLAGIVNWKLTPAGPLPSATGRVHLP